MKIYGGRNMVDKFVLNYAGPTLKNVKRENKRGLQFIFSEHWEIYGIVAKIYRYAKIAHVITWPIMTILPKDETKAKAQAAWEAKDYVLMDFLGLRNIGSQ